MSTWISTWMEPVALYEWSSLRTILKHFRWSHFAKRFKFHAWVEKCHFGNFSVIGWSAGCIGHALQNGSQIFFYSKNICMIKNFSRVFCCEFTLMFVSLASVPTIMIWLLFCWPKMEDNKVEEKPEQFMPWMEVTNEFWINFIILHYW